ncbi:Disease resistance protein [Melia azedarach]|uniref:Disease resistance protein n=1 Tax=Melia azedarach TaxID=155640 RepID=A0ACC1X7X4_MELAZ|nr:Disease resistance protein [Melia azedarach]
MGDIIVEIGIKVAECLFNPIWRRSSYLRNYTSNVENLNNGVEKLTDVRESMQNKVVGARRKGEKIEKRVEKWLTNAEKKIDEAENLIKEEDEANKRFCRGLCPNLKKRYQLSKKAVMMEKEVVVLKEEAEKFDQISYRSVQEEAWLSSIKGYEAFESRMSTLRDIQNALTDPAISIIGVHGMGGIGKTTLVKEVGRQTKKDKLFDEVIFTELSQSADTKIIQTEIAEKLGLELREETESGRANRLYEELKNHKKILLVLDNIWKHLDLENVGIPYEDDHKGCKVLLTARDRNVLLKTGSKDNFSISVLNEEEAWRLFKKMVGDDVENRKLKSVATDVAKACGGLPIAIITTARALRNKSVPQWKNALRELRTPSLGNFEGVPAEAYSTIELSYKYLKGVFQGVNTMEEARDKLYALVHELKDSCLLLECDSSTKFSMHDVVRDVGTSIACRDQHAFVVRNKDLWKWPDKDKLGKCTTICLSDSNINELPEGLECLQLEFLFVDMKASSVEIPENFFLGMRKLRVVDLTGMQLTSLPSSFDVLTNLQTLCLDQCAIEDVAIIEKLKNLEILSFVGSDIIHLPKELAQLTKLRLLDLRYCSKLKVIAPHVISTLTQLEELYMSNCSVEWEVEGPNSERRNASLNELVHLPYLAALEIHIKNDNILPKGLLSKKLARYCISIGDGLFEYYFILLHFGSWYRFNEWYNFDEQQTSRMLKLKLDSMRICSENLQGVKDVEYLCLDKLQGVENVVFQLDIEGFTQLKRLYVQNNPDMLYIVDSMERVHCDAFPLLESFTLYNLINLEKICCDKLIAESFNELNTIRVKNRNKLQNIFSFSTTKCLPRLQKIAVIDCGNMEEIFAIKGENDANNSQVHDKIEFAQLTSLSLGSLPQLTCFCKVVKTEENLITSSSSQLFSEKVLMPNLEALELYEINVENLWHDQLPAMSYSCFRSLTRLIVQNCNKLRYIFSTAMVKSIELLQHLEICNCLALEEIISREGTEGATSFVFPRVTTLILCNLPELICFCPGMHTSEWPVLEKLEAYSCDKVKIFGSELFSFNQESQFHSITVQQPLLLVDKVFLNLEELKLSGKEIKMIWQCEFPENLLSKIKFLEVKNDESTSFPLVLLERFDNLEKLGLAWSSYKEIFSSGQVEKHVVKLAKIKSLRLSGLFGLNQVWEQNSKTDSIFQHLEILEVLSCENLTSLLPSSLSFQHLKELEVWDCEKLVNLVTSTTAKSLVQLVKMTISRCSGMTEVVVAAAASEGNNVIFSKLDSLTLRNLESLASFCSGNCTFKFSSLQKLVVIDCPKMKHFSRGELSTKRVVVWYGNGADEWLWDSDLNTTIEQLHKQKLLQSL